MRGRGAGAVGIQWREGMRVIAALTHLNRGRRVRRDDESRAGQG